MLKNEEKKLNTSEGKNFQRFDYAYVSGYYRAIESKLLTANTVSAIFDSRTVADVGAILAENGFAVAQGIEKAVQDDLILAYDEAQKLIPDPNFIYVLMAFNDYHNIKVIAKAFIQASSARRPGSDTEDDGLSEEGETDKLDKAVKDLIEVFGSSVRWEDLEDSLAYPSKYDPEYLFRVVKDPSIDFSDNEKNLEKIFDQIFSAFVKSSDPGQVDLLVDKLLFEDLARYRELLNNKFINDYIDYKADTTNLSTLLRLRAMGAPMAKLEASLVPGGKIDRKAIIDSFGGDSEEVIEVYEGTAYEALAQYTDNYGAENSAMEFGRMVDDLLMDMLEVSKGILFGPEIILAYLMTKDMQSKNINIALTCLRNNVPKAISLSMRRKA